MANQKETDWQRRSLTSDQSTEVTFENVSSRSVAVLWLDYRGQPVWYYHLPGGRSYRQQTYVTHPWICVECDSGLFELMKVNGRDVLYPTVTPLHAVIASEEKTLFEQCLSAVRGYMHEGRHVSLLDRLREGDVGMLPVSGTCTRQLVELDSTPPPGLAEPYVNKLKEKLKPFHRSQWDEILSHQTSDPPLI